MCVCVFVHASDFVRCSLATVTLSYHVCYWDTIWARTFRCDLNINDETMFFLHHPS